MREYVDQIFGDMQLEEVVIAGVLEYCCRAARPVEEHVQLIIVQSTSKSSAKADIKEAEAKFYELYSDYQLAARAVPLFPGGLRMYSFFFNENSSLSILTFPIFIVSDARLKLAKTLLRNTGVSLAYAVFDILAVQSLPEDEIDVSKYVSFFCFAIAFVFEDLLNHSCTGPLRSSVTMIGVNFLLPSAPSRRSTARNCWHPHKEKM